MEYERKNAAVWNIFFSRIEYGRKIMNDDNAVPVDAFKCLYTYVCVCVQALDQLLWTRI